MGRVGRAWIDRSIDRYTKTVWRSTASLSGGSEDQDDDNLTIDGTLTLLTQRPFIWELARFAATQPETEAAAAAAEAAAASSLHAGCTWMLQRHSDLWLRLLRLRLRLWSIGIGKGLDLSARRLPGNISREKENYKIIYAVVKTNKCKTILKKVKVAMPCIRNGIYWGRNGAHPISIAISLSHPSSMRARHS